VRNLFGRLHASPGSREIRYRAKGPINAENAEVMLNFLREGYQQDPTNQRILGHLTQLRSSEIPGIAELAANIYQPNEKAPASVENILGTQALAKGNYLEAAKHMTRATQKDEKNGDYLNNLAYLYLVRPNPDPQEALKLIDRAIINVQYWRWENLLKRMVKKQLRPVSTPLQPLNF